MLWRTCMSMATVMLIWEWLRIFITTRGATPAAVRRVAVSWRASLRQMRRRPAEAATRVKEHKHTGGSDWVFAPAGMQGHSEVCTLIRLSPLPS